MPPKFWVVSWSDTVLNLAGQWLRRNASQWR